MSAWTKAKELLTPWLRRLLCLILCVSLLLCPAPQKVDALALETVTVAGIVACLILMSVGVVFNPKTIEDVKAIGQNFQLHMYQWGTSAEKLDEVEDWFNGLSLYSPDDDDWSPNKTKIRLARGILTGISLWCASIMLGENQVEKEGEAAPDGFFYYNGLLLPDISDLSISYPEAVLLRDDNGIWLFKSQFDCVYRIEEGTVANALSVKYGPGYSFYKYLEDTQSFEYWSGGSHVSQTYGVPLWANHDIYTAKYDGADYVQCDLYLPASEPSKYYLESLVPSIVDDVSEDLEYGDISDEELPLYDLNYGTLLPDPAAPLESVQDLGDMLVAGTLTLDEYLEMGQAADPGASEPVWTQDIPLGSAVEYEQNSVADPVEVLASVDDGGTISYEWYRYGTDPDGNVYPAEVVETGPVLVPQTAELGTSYYYCSAYNTSESGLVSFRVASSAIAVTVVPASAVDPDPGTDPEPGGDSDTDADVDAGQDFVDQLQDVIPNYSEGFGNVLSDFASNFSYEGTDAVLTIPALRFPEIPGMTKGKPLIPEYVLMEEQKVDFAEYLELVPDVILTLVRCLLTGALILFCIKEFYNVVAYILTLRKEG